MSYFDKHGQHWAIFPNREIAHTAAAGACRWDVGGYDGVTVHPVQAAAMDAKHYQHVTDWLFEGEDFDHEGDADQLAELGPVAKLLRRAMQGLASIIAAQPQELINVEWRDLERLLFEVFEGLGFDTTLTRPAKDGGFDLRLVADGFTYFVEVKHWAERSKVGEGIVSRFTEFVISNGGEA
jgi:hypothetical protein